MMNYRQIETSREIRLWVTGIIMPVLLGTAAILVSNPDLLDDVKVSVRKKVDNFKNIRRGTL